VITLENRKKNPTPVYFTPPLTEFPLEFGYRRTESKKARMVGLPDGQKVLR